LPNETIALAKPRPDVPNEDAYQAFCAALSETARGRAFLAEFARRNRNADTELLLSALARLEALVRSPTAADLLRQELRALLETIRSARPQINTRALPARAAKLAGLLDLLERRIDEMVEAKVVEAAMPAAETLGAHTMPEVPMVEPMDEPGRSYLAVVEPPDEPELPIPSPASAQPLVMVVVGAAAAMPEVSVFDSAPPKPDVVETSMAAPAARSASATALPPVDPLLAIMALSEDERIALFT
jgi:hypothetical protein